VNTVILFKEGTRQEKELFMFIAKEMPVINKDRVKYIF